MEEEEEEDVDEGGVGGAKSEHKNQCKHKRYKVTSSISTMLCLDTVVKGLFVLV